MGETPPPMDDDLFSPMDESPSSIDKPAPLYFVTAIDEEGEQVHGIYDDPEACLRDRSEMEGKDLKFVSSHRLDEDISGTLSFLLTEEDSTPEGERKAINIEIVKLRKFLVECIMEGRKMGIENTLRRN